MQVGRKATSGIAVLITIGFGMTAANDTANTCRRVTRIDMMASALAISSTPYWLEVRAGQVLVNPLDRLASFYQII